MREIIDNLRKAKMAHKRWVGHASALIEGLPIDKNQVPINHTDCAFGSWYYGEGQKLSVLKEFKDIEDPHSQLHEIYMQIFKILFQKKKVSFFGKLIGKSTKTTEDDKQLARAKYQTLVQVSNKIVDSLNILEQKLKQLGEEEVAKLI